MKILLNFEYQLTNLWYEVGRSWNLETYLSPCKLLKVIYSVWNSNPCISFKWLNNAGLFGKTQLQSVSRQRLFQLSFASVESFLWTSIRCLFNFHEVGKTFAQTSHKKTIFEDVTIRKTYELLRNLNINTNCRFCQLVVHCLKHRLRLHTIEISYGCD